LEFAYSLPVAWAKPALSILSMLSPVTDSGICRNYGNHGGNGNLENGEITEEMFEIIAKIGI
jgi:hypothetical protein